MPAKQSAWSSRLSLRRLSRQRKCDPPVLLLVLLLFFAYLLVPLVRLAERWLTQRRALDQLAAEVMTAGE